MTASPLSPPLQPNEAYRATFTADLDASLHYAVSTLVLTDNRLLLLEAGSAGGWQAWGLDEIAAIERDDTGILGKMEIQGADGPLALLRYTLRQSPEASDFVDSFELTRVGSDDRRQVQALAAGAGPVRHRHSPLIRLLAFARGHLSGVLTGLALTLTATAVGLIPPYLTMPLVDQVLISPPPPGAPIGAHWVKVMYLIGGLVLAALGTWLLTWGQGWVLARVSERVSADLRNRTYAHLQRLSLEYFGGKRTGDLIARISHDTEYLCSFLSDKLVDFLTDILMIVGTAAVLLYLDPFLAIASLLAFPPIAWLILQARSGLTTGFLRGGRVWDAMTNILADTIPGIRVVKAFSQERREIARFERANRRIVEANDRVNRLWTFFWPLVGLLTQLGLLVVWAFGSWQVLHHRISVGMLTAFVAYIGRFYARVETMSRMLTATQRASVSAQRLFEILDRRPKVVDPPNPLPLPQVRGELRLHEISFRYGARTVLDKVELTIKPGEMVGIVGHTGSGKSTIANLVCRFYDVAEGSLEVDGVDVRRYTVEDYRKHVGIVLQESFLFYGTVADNVVYGKPDATRDRVLQATRAARAHDFVLRLPEAYDSLVGERGQSLSGGERQRLAIARALLVDPRVLVLDEATSAVDTETEREIQRALDSLVRGRTTVAIAHRLSTLRKADRIVVLRRGRIVEEGPHEELLALDGEYARLYRAQTQGLGEAGAPVVSRRGRELEAEPEAPASAVVFDPRDLELQPAAPGHLWVRLPSWSEPQQVSAVRCFPLTDPLRFIALVDAQGRELLCIDELAALEEEAQRLVLGSVTERDFVPVIEHIERIDVAAGQSEWKVRTDRGRTTFLLDQDDQLRNLGRGRWIVTDAWGGRYIIEDLERLDAASRREMAKVA